MEIPRSRWPVFGSSRITWLIPFLSIFLIYDIIYQEVAVMQFKPSFIAAAAAGLARHGVAQAIDLSWHAPNATAINNLTQVVGGDGIYGWILNNSATPDNEYGIYNWCNMPHVRKTEYKKPSSEYKLQYVELARLLTLNI